MSICGAGALFQGWSIPAFSILVLRYKLKSDQLVQFSSLMATSVSLGLNLKLNSKEMRTQSTCKGPKS